MSNQSGPTGLTGKLASCMNNLQHGGTSTSLFLKDEKPEEFFALLENAFQQHQPATDQDAGIVTRSVHDHWILLRRERTADAFEAALHERKPDPRYWVPVDLHEMNLFDRYKTAAARAYTRSLKDLQTIQKMARDEQRWQHQLAMQKQKLSLDVERWELAKQREARLTAKSEAKAAQKEEAAIEAELPIAAALPPIPIPTQTGIHQTLYIGYEDDITTIYEITPSNGQIRRRISEGGQVTRTYNFVGGVPPAYEHLITPDALRHGASTSVRKTLSFDEWNRLAESE